MIIPVGRWMGIMFIEARPIVYIQNMNYRLKYSSRYDIMIFHKAINTQNTLQKYSSPLVYYFAGQFPDTTS